MKNLRLENANNAIISHLNINSFKNKHSLKKRKENVFPKENLFPLLISEISF